MKGSQNLAGEFGLTASDLSGTGSQEGAHLKPERECERGDG